MRESSEKMIERNKDPSVVSFTSDPAPSSASRRGDRKSAVGNKSESADQKSPEAAVPPVNQTVQNTWKPMVAVTVCVRVYIYIYIYVCVGGNVGGKTKS